MATFAQAALMPPKPAAWFLKFLKEELAPYPGRTGTVIRMVAAASAVMIICMTFRVPYGFQGAIYALLISRESPRATLQSSGTILFVTGIGAVYVLISARFVISSPLLHFLWIIGSFFLAFYVLSTMTSYGASSTFAIMISVGVPLWDRHVSAETNVEDTLWLTLAACIGVVVTTAVELVFTRMGPGDDIVLPVAERLVAVESVLACYIGKRPVDEITANKIARLGLLGTSTLRRVLRRSDYSPKYIAQMGGVVALVGGLVDIAAAMTQLDFQLRESGAEQLRKLAVSVARIRTNLTSRRISGSIQFNFDDQSTRGVPFLREMEKLVELIPQAFASSRSTDVYVPSSDDIPKVKLFAPDAFVNPEHLEFALKGCLAASICYITYNALAWPGIATAVTTCLLTALSTIGVSRQKQILRFAGALVGGFFLGMGSQIFILPYVDSIAGFTVLFVFVTVVASWIMTSSPRLSYFGLQVALAFYLINLQEFAMQTSLSVARDRVVGILLGLFMMWLVFDQLWGARAAVEMKRTFISNLRLLAQLVREPLPGREKTGRRFSLRETINANFNKVRSLADGVLFELGSSRQQDLALRNRIRQWQPQLQAVFLTRIALLEYCLQLPGFDLPPAVRVAQQEFDGHLAKVLETMADVVKAKASERKDHPEPAFEVLEEAVRSCCPEGPQELAPAELQTFLDLSRNIENLTLSLNNGILESLGPRL